MAADDPFVECCAKLQPAEPLDLDKLEKPQHSTAPHSTAKSSTAKHSAPSCSLDITFASCRRDAACLLASAAMLAAIQSVPGCVCKVASRCCLQQYNCHQLKLTRYRGYAVSLADAPQILSRLAASTAGAKDASTASTLVPASMTTVAYITAVSRPNWLSLPAFAHARCH